MFCLYIICFMSRILTPMNQHKHNKFLFCYFIERDRFNCQHSRISNKIRKQQEELCEYTNRLRYTPKYFWSFVYYIINYSLLGGCTLAYQPCKFSTTTLIAIGIWSVSALKSLIELVNYYNP